MILMLLITMAFCIGCFVNFKKTVLLWNVCSIVFNVGTCLKYTSPAITVTLAVNAFIVIFYIIKNRGLQIKTLPLRGAFGFIIFSYVLTFIFSPLKSNINTLLSLVINECLSLYIFYCYIETLKDLRYAFKVGFIIVSISVFYAIFTLAIQSNPVIAWESSLSGDLMKVVVADGTARGMKLQSFFASPTDFNIYLFLFVAFVAFAYDCKLFKLSVNNLVFILITCIGIAFLSKNRAGMVAPIILYLVMSIHSKVIKKVFLIGGLIIGVLLLSGIHFTYLASIFSDKAQESVGGSNVEMREQQFNIVISWFLNSPLVGLGLDAVSYVKERDYEIYGGESIWFRLLLERGLLGLLSYIVFLVSSYRLITNSKCKRYYMYACIYLLTINTLTLNSVGIYYPYYLSFLILFKAQKLFKGYEVCLLNHRS